MKGKQLTSEAAKQRRKHYGTARWKRLRAKVLKGNPVCFHCRAAPATQADHLKHTDDNAHFWDASTIVPSCGPCNNSRGAADRHGRDKAGGRGRWERGAGGAAACGYTQNSFQQNLAPTSEADRLASRLMKTAKPIEWKD